MISAILGWPETFAAGQLRFAFADGHHLGTDFVVTRRPGDHPDEFHRFVHRPKSG